MAGNSQLGAINYIKMTILFDFDSLLYKSVYRILSIEEMKAMIALCGKLEARDIVLDASLSRLENQVINILQDIENLWVSINNIEYYITCCTNSFRKKICTKYKSNRKRNRWVSQIRDIVKDTYDARYSDSHEADDLIAIRANELGLGNYLIVSIDKDLKQIEGLHYDYYIDKKTNTTRGISIVSNYEAKYMIAYQMIVGDSTDNITGISGIGEKKAIKALKGKSIIGLGRAVVSLYNEKSSREEMRKNYKLIKLGK